MSDIIKLRKGGLTDEITRLKLGEGLKIDYTPGEGLARISLEDFNFPAPTIQLVVTPEFGFLRCSAITTNAVKWRLYARRNIPGQVVSTLFEDGKLIEDFLVYEGDMYDTQIPEFIMMIGEDASWNLAAVAFNKFGVPSTVLQTFTSTQWTNPGSPQLALQVTETRILDHRKEDAVEGLKGFTDWTSQWGVKGFIYEVGWPSPLEQRPGLWNQVAEEWFDHANLHNLWACTWATGEFWREEWNYVDLQYLYRVNENGVGSYHTMETNIPLENNNTTQYYKRGINVSGAEHGFPNVPATWPLSNQNVGTYGRDEDYWYDSPGMFAFLASRGINFVRFPIRWERFQRTLGGALHADEVARLTAVLDACQANGIQVVIDLHNYGAYYLYDPSIQQGRRYSIGTTQVTIAHFQDFWSRFCTQFKNHPALHSYELMNEPTGMTGGAAVWESAVNAAISTIRQQDTNRTICVPSYNWSHTWAFRTEHTTLNPNWVQDPATGNLSKIVFVAHHYWDDDHSGRYEDKIFNAGDHYQILVKWVPNMRTWDLGGSDTYRVKIYEEGVLVAEKELWQFFYRKAPLKRGFSGDTYYEAYDFKVELVNKSFGDIIHKAQGRWAGQYETDITQF